MQETFIINDTEIIVDYNDFLYTHEEVEKLLKSGVKSESRFEAITSEIEIINYSDVVNKLFRKKIKNTVEQDVDLTGYLPVVNIIGKPLEELLWQTFRIEIVQKLEGNIYRLRGPKRGFKDLDDVIKA